MKFSELLDMLRKMAESISAADTEDMAVNFRMTDISEPDIDNDDQKREPGIFYISIKNGNAEIMPYRYNDTDCTISMKQDNFIKLINGKLDAVAAFTFGKLKVDGSIDLALKFANVIKKIK